MVTSVKKIATKFKVLGATAVAATVAVTTVALGTVVANAQSNLIAIDGSSTVFPITEAVAEEYMAANPGTNISVGVSGTGGGFKKFCAGETVISNASRPIKDSELADCQANGINPERIDVAYDAITVVINPANTFARNLTVDQLQEMWSSETPPTSWAQIDPSFPDEPLNLYGPGTDSGTFDYFNEVILGDDLDSRGDYTASEDDNVIVTGVQSASGGMGYFGYAYFEENSDSLKAIEIENEDGACIAPSIDVIADGSYNPMSRPLFIYVKKEANETKEQVKAFVDYNLDPANGALVQEAGYVPLPDADLAAAKGIIESGNVGKDPS